jgi:hypothetical protein
MKKTLIALAALGVVGAASAQVTVTGAIYAGVENTPAATKPVFVHDADITFSASEDLGGGLSIAVSTGFSQAGGRYDSTSATTAAATSANNNNTTVSLTTGMGTLRWEAELAGTAAMGNVSTNAGYDLTASTGGYVKRRQFSYDSPELVPGGSVTLEWTGASPNAALEYGGTPNLALKYKAGAADIYFHTGGTSKNWDARVSYDAGVAKLGVRTTKTKIQELAVTMPMGASTVFVSNARDTTAGAKKSSTGVGVTYAMSKQTSLIFGYATHTGITNPGSNYSLRLNKAF